MNSSLSLTAMEDSPPQGLRWRQPFGDLRLNQIHKRWHCCRVSGDSPAPFTC